MNLKMWEQTKEIAAAQTSKYFEIFPLRTKGKICKQEIMKNKDIGKKHIILKWQWK